MTPLQFKVTNKAEYDDLMQTIERERPKVGWVRGGEKPTQWQPMTLKSFKGFPIVIEFYMENKIFWQHLDEVKHPRNQTAWQLGQSLPLSTLEAFCAIPENEDGSITIPSTLAVAIVKELTR